jgi:hypothetical protein
VTLPIALAIILGIAIIPGYLNVQLASSLVLDRPRPLEPHEALPGITLIVAAYNEEQAIAETLAYALRSDYAGPLEVVVADAGRRTRRARSFARRYLFPFLDGMYSLAFLPGVVLACMGKFLIVGPMTLAVLPINILIASVMLTRQRTVFRELGLRIRQNRCGFLSYLLLYSPMMSPVSFVGYVKELAGTKRRWK